MRIRRLALLLLSCIAIILIGVSITSIIVSKTASSRINACNPLDCNPGADLDTFPLPEVGSVRGGAEAIQFRGISLSGGEIPDMPELVREGAFLPFDDDATLFIYKGMNTFRIPIAWEYLASRNGIIPPGSNYFQRLDRVVRELLAKNAMIILDVHNYMRYNPDNIGLNLLNTDPRGTDIIGIGTNAPSRDAIRRFWQELVSHFRMPNITYSIMNAPHDVSFTDLNAYNAIAIDSIRFTEFVLRISPHLILVEGNNFSRLDAWFSGNDAMFNLPITDRANNFAISVRQFFDKDGSGSGRYFDNECLSLTQVRNNFDHYWPLFKNWAISHKVRIFISEFGVPDTPQCKEVMNYVLTQWVSFPFSQANQAGLIGWTVWRGGHSGRFWGQDPVSLDAGGRANLLMWNNTLYERYLPTFPLSIPPLTNNRIALTIINESPFDLMFVFGYVPFQFKGSASILRGGNTGFLYSNNNSTQPTGALEMLFMINNDSTRILSFRFSETGQIIVDNPISLLTIDGNFAQGCIGCTVIVS